MRPSQRQVVAVEQGFAHPMEKAAVEHSMHWVAVRVGSRHLHLACCFVGSILVGELVVPGVANLKKPRHWLFSSSHYCEIAAARQSELWLLLPGLRQL